MIDFTWAQEHFPYAAAMVSGTPAQRVSKGFFEQLLLSVVVATAAAMGTSYMTISKLEAKAEFSQTQFKEQVERRNKELDQIRNQLSADSLRSQVQYEALRQEMQRLAVSMERREYRTKGDRQ